PFLVAPPQHHPRARRSPSDWTRSPVRENVSTRWPMNGVEAPHGARPDLRSAEEKARARRCVGEDGSRPVLPDQRKPSGCMMTSGENLGTALAGLERASRHRLAEHWAEYFGTPPPPRTSRSLMIR